MEQPMDSLRSIATLHIIFWVFLPALLFEDAAGTEWSVIQRVLPSSLLLAFPGVVYGDLSGNHNFSVLGIAFLANSVEN